MLQFKNLLKYYEINLISLAILLENYLAKYFYL
jgi:hypothetical protein